jgi:hypothetical protein
MGKMGKKNNVRVIRGQLPSIALMRQRLHTGNKTRKHRKNWKMSAENTKQQVVTALSWVNWLPWW